MAPPRLFSLAYISPQNHPVLVRTFATDEDGKRQQSDVLKAYYIAHTSLDVFDERLSTPSKSSECYLGLLYALDDVAVYGYITPTRLKLVLAFTTTDALIKDSEVSMIFRAMHIAYYRSVSNPFLRLGAPDVVSTDPVQLLQSNQSAQWKAFEQRVDQIAEAVGPALTSRNSMF